MFGYATDETAELMPLPIMLAHQICKRLAEVRKADVLPYLRPDGKSQVTVATRRRARLQRPVEIVRCSSPPSTPTASTSTTLIKPDIIEHVLHPILPRDLYDEKRFDDARLRLRQPDRAVRRRRPDGRHRPHRPQDHRRHLRRLGPHGGGAFSGKDPTKVDRSAAYAARYVAKNVVAAGLADRCEVQVAYAIGVAHPVSIVVDTFGTEKVPDAQIEELVREHFDLRPAAIIRDLDLRRPIYAKTAAYGHFGRDDHDFTWERTDKAEALRKAAGLVEASFLPAPSVSGRPARQLVAAPDRDAPDAQGEQRHSRHTQRSAKLKAIVQPLSETTNGLGTPSGETTIERALPSPPPTISPARRRSSASGRAGRSRPLAAEIASISTRLAVGALVVEAGLGRIEQLDDQVAGSGAPATPSSVRRACETAACARSRRAGAVLDESPQP